MSRPKPSPPYVDPVLLDGALSILRDRVLSGRRGLISDAEPAAFAAWMFVAFGVVSPLLRPPGAP